MEDRIVELKENREIDPDLAKKQLTTYMLLGQMLQEQEVAEGRRAPDSPQLQLSGKGWQVWGGNFTEPIPFTVAEVYEKLLDVHGAEEAQHVLDMTRERCGELRMAAKSARGKAKEEIEEAWSNLRKELDAAIQIKTERGIVML